jgi:uncharacterized membrane protein
MDYTLPAAIISGGAIITAAILKFSKANGYITRKEFQIWSESFEKRWDEKMNSLEDWIKTIQTDIKELRYNG